MVCARAQDTVSQSARTHHTPSLTHRSSIHRAYGYIQELNPLYQPLLTRDQCIRESLSEVPEGLPGLPDLGVQRTTIDTVAIQFLRRFRKHVFHDEHVSERSSKPKKYEAEPTPL